MFWPKMQRPWPTVLAFLIMTGMLGGIIGFATLFFKYGTTWYQPATIDDQRRLEGYATSLSPPGTGVAFSHEEYSRLEPVAYVTATYANKKGVTPESLTRYYDRAFRDSRSQLCAAQENSFTGPIVKTYRNSYTVAILTIPSSAPIRTYEIAFAWRIPPGPC